MRLATNKRALVSMTSIAAVGALALGACGGGGSATTGESKADAPKPANDGVIRAAAGYDTDNYDPHATGSALALAANWHTQEGLTELDPVTRKVYKALAKELPTKVDDTTYEVTLRDGAKFSDGTDVTVDDVIASFKLTMENKMYGPMVGFIESVDKKDDRTIVVKTKAPVSVFNERLSLIKINPASQDAAGLKSSPIGTGPYKMTSAVKSKAVEFEKNEHYNGDRPAGADKMHWDILVDDTARITAMTSGTVHAMENVPAVNKATLEGKAKMESKQGFGLPFMMFNTKKAPFDNPKVRQAVMYAIDAEEIAKNVLGGEAAPATSFLQKDHPNYNQAKNVFAYDPEKAKALLAEAGVSDLKFTLNTTDHGWIKQMAPLIQQQMAKAGITIDKIDTQATASMYPNVTDVDNPQFDIALAPGDPSVFGSDPDLLMSWWYGDNVWTNKRTQWKDSEGYTKLHALMDQALAAEGAAQQDLWNQCFDLLSEEVPLYPILHRSVTGAWNDSALDGYQPVAVTGMSFLDVKLK